MPMPGGERTGFDMFFGGTIARTLLHVCPEPELELGTYEDGSARTQPRVEPGAGTYEGGAA